MNKGSLLFVAQSVYLLENRTQQIDRVIVLDHSSVRTSKLAECGVIHSKDENLMNAIGTILMASEIIEFLIPNKTALDQTESRQNPQ